MIHIPVFLFWLTSVFLPSAIPQGAIYGGTAGAGPPTFTVVASGIKDCVTTFPCTLTGLTLTAGDALRVDYIFQDNGAASTVAISDNGSSTYSASFEDVDGVSGGNATAGQKVTLALASSVTSITMTPSGSPATHVGGFNWIQYHRTSGSWATDQTGTAGKSTFATTTTQTCNAITTTGTPSVAMAWIYQNTDATHNFTGGGSYTAEQNNQLASNGYVLGSLDRIQTSAGSTTASATTGASVSGTCYPTSLK